MPIQDVALMPHIARKGMIDRLPSVKTRVALMNEEQETLDLRNVAGQSGRVRDCVCEHALSQLLQIVCCVVPSPRATLVVTDTRVPLSTQHGNALRPWLVWLNGREVVTA